jgi:hypothetical protein
MPVDSGILWVELVFHGNPNGAVLIGILSL